MRAVPMAAALAALALPLLADWNVHVDIGSPPYYGFAPADVVYVERYVPASHVPFVFVAARHARLRPVVIADAWRFGGWDSVCSRYRVPRHVLFAPAPVAPPPVAVYAPYGRPHPMHYRHAFKPPRGHWR